MLKKTKALLDEFLRLEPAIRLPVLPSVLVVRLGGEPKPNTGSTFAEKPLLAPPTTATADLLGRCEAD